MEKQTINIKITTEGDKCEMVTEAIQAWYEEKIKSLFNPEFGTPIIEVEVNREEI